MCRLRESVEEVGEHKKKKKTRNKYRGVVYVFENKWINNY